MFQSNVESRVPQARVVILLQAGGGGGVSDPQTPKPIPKHPKLPKAGAATGATDETSLGSKTRSCQRVLGFRVLRVGDLGSRVLGLRLPT